jgi:tetratricopeptide (TPR) repeat protein
MLVGLYDIGFLNKKSAINTAQDEVEDVIEAELDAFGNCLLLNNKTDYAIKVFALNVKIHPQSANVYNSLGEAYIKTQNREMAILNYQKSLELNPCNEHAKNKIQSLQG